MSKIQAYGKTSAVNPNGLVRKARFTRPSQTVPKKE